MRNGVSLEDRQRWMRERQTPPQRQPCDHIERKPHLERQFTVPEIAAIWHRSPDFIRRIFEHRPGVAVVQNRSSGARRRSYTTLLVPESVLEETYLELSNH